MEVPMDRPQSSDFTAHERAAIARLLESARDALADQTIEHAERFRLAAYLAVSFDEASMCVRRGYRANRLDAIVGELDRYRDQLDKVDAS